MLVDFRAQEANTFQTNILLQILNSRRLLADHVEVLEECLDSYSSYRNAKRSPRIGTAWILLSSVSGAAVLLLGRNRLKWTSPLLGIVAACGGSYFYKWFNLYNYNRQHRILAELIQSFELFEAAVRKNILFLHESQYIRTVRASLEKTGTGEDVYIGELFHCLVETIRSIHSALKTLELQFRLDDKWSHLYTPMEELNDCDLLQANNSTNEINLRIIKDIYNVFAYVQSQYLVRLGLSVASEASNPVLYTLPPLTVRIQKATGDCLKKVSKIVESSRQRVARIRSCTYQLPPEVLNLRTNSLALLAKLVSAIHQFNALDESLEGILQRCDQQPQTLLTSLESLEDPLQVIANELLGSGEECQRLLVILRKALNKEDSLQGESSLATQQEAVSENKDGEDKIYSEQDKPILRDEFFAVDGTEVTESKRQSVGFLEDLEGINAKIVKRHFKPVLKQLRERIEPIGVEFRERERKVLLDKGIDLNRLDDEMKELVRNNPSYCSESEDDEECTTVNAARVSRKNEQRYDDMRGFLAAKEQMSIFGLRPMSSLVSEDVLE
ncbi:uncharacterized protein LOC128732631 [Sabethes cyaneus]|uniref:uncharacterized protein LOC128732631 n=1 Tax=Sabethes cyaneus TaxID=53552 RepID=UPI00237D85D3|nr:uncharacterized protein LOC128732631 [Sabethes cyaneus]